MFFKYTNTFRMDVLHLENVLDSHICSFNFEFTCTVGICTVQLLLCADCFDCLSKEIASRCRLVIEQFGCAARASRVGVVEHSCERVILTSVQ